MWRNKYLFEIQAVNARGTFLGMKYAVEQMMKQDPLPSGERGWIINMTSVGGQVGLMNESMSKSTGLHPISC